MIAALLLAITISAPLGSPPEVYEIVVHSDASLGQHATADYRYEWSGQQYGDGHGHALSLEAVQELVAAIDRAPVAFASLATLDEPADAVPNRKAILACAPSLDAALIRYYASRSLRAGDFPQVGVSLRFTSGRRIELSSGHPGHLMLPWTVVEAGASHETFDGGLARAIAPLIPPLDANAVRFAGRRAGASWWSDVQSVACRTNGNRP